MGPGFRHAPTMPVKLWVIAKQNSNTSRLVHNIAKRVRI